MYGTFVSNYQHYTAIRDEGLADEVKGLIDNRLLLHEAKAIGGSRDSGECSPSKIRDSLV